MTYNEIVSLMDLGFTVDQIMQLTAAPADPVPAAAPADQPPAAPAATPADQPPAAAPAPADQPPAAAPAPADQPPAAAPAPADQPPAAAPADALHDLMDVIKGMSTEISALKAAQQNSNIKNVIRESAADTQSADDILAGFINPPYEKNENGGKNK